ncbi:hypothetical protein, partial [Aquifex sp.]
RYDTASIPVTGIRLCGIESKPQRQRRKQSKRKNSLPHIISPQSYTPLSTFIIGYGREIRRTTLIGFRFFAI